MIFPSNKKTYFQELRRISYTPRYCSNSNSSITELVYTRNILLCNHQTSSTKISAFT